MRELRRVLNDGIHCLTKYLLDLQLNQVHLVGTHAVCKTHVCYAGSYNVELGLFVGGFEYLKIIRFGGDVFAFSFERVNIL